MSTNNEVVSKIINYIDSHLDEDLNLDHISYQVGYSKYHLSRVFTKNIGCTLHQYIKNKRLENAANQLILTKLPIIEIAFISGYESQQSFTYAFKQLYMESPQVYRRKKSMLQARLLSKGSKSYHKMCIHYCHYSTFLQGGVKAA